MSISKKWLEKVAGLFNLADNNPNENEAMSAMAKAQEMMVKRGISDDDLKNFKREKVGQGKYTEKDVVREFVSNPENEIPLWKSSLASIIAKHFRCYCVRMHVGNNKVRLEYTGLEEDVELAVLTLNYAVYCIVYNSEMYIAQRKRVAKRMGEPLSKKDADGIQNDYMFGFIKGLDDKLREQVEQNGWGLIVVKDEAVVKVHEARSDLFKSKKRTYKSAGDAEAKAKGYQDGNSFQKQSGYID